MERRRGDRHWNPRSGTSSFSNSASVICRRGRPPIIPEMTHCTDGMIASPLPAGSGWGPTEFFSGIIPSGGKGKFGPEDASPLETDTNHFLYQEQRGNTGQIPGQETVVFTAPVLRLPPQPPPLTRQTEEERPMVGPARSSDLLDFPRPLPPATGGEGSVRAFFPIREYL